MAAAASVTGSLPYLHTPSALPTASELKDRISALAQSALAGQLPPESPEFKITADAITRFHRRRVDSEDVDINAAYFELCMVRVEWLARGIFDVPEIQVPFISSLTCRADWKKYLDQTREAIARYAIDINKPQSEEASLYHERCLRVLGHYIAPYSAYFSQDSVKPVVTGILQVLDELATVLPKNSPNGILPLPRDPPSCKLEWHIKNLRTLARDKRLAIDCPLWGNCLKAIETFATRPPSQSSSVEERDIHAACLRVQMEEIRCYLLFGSFPPDLMIVRSTNLGALMRNIKMYAKELAEAHLPKRLPQYQRYFDHLKFYIGLHAKDPLSRAFVEKLLTALSCKPVDADSIQQMISLLKI